MTKKHFIALADAVRYEGFSDHELRVLCSFMQRQNRNFDRDRWIGYVKGTCGPNGGKVKP